MKINHGVFENLTDLLASLFLYYFPQASTQRPEIREAEIFLGFLASRISPLSAKIIINSNCGLCDKMLFRTNTEKRLPKLFVSGLN